MNDEGSVLGKEAFWKTLEEIYILLQKMGPELSSGSILRTPITGSSTDLHISSIYGLIDILIQEKEVFNPTSRKTAINLIGQFISSLESSSTESYLGFFKKDLHTLYDGLIELK